MQKSKIEWTDYTWNPITGCTKGCSYCYARRMAENPYYAKSFPNKFAPTFLPARVMDLRKIPEGSKVFVCSMGELFGENREWTDWVINRIRDYSNLTFQVLTKRPLQLAKWSPFPDNCWVGVSATGDMSYMEAYFMLANTVDAKVKFISLEPFLERISPGHIDSSMKHINWLIIGQQTPVKTATQPKIEWIQDILVAAHNAGDIPVFMKNNLQPLLTGGWSGWKLRQEFPRLTDK